MDSKEINDVIDIQGELKDFCGKYKKIYLYGAGKVAESYLDVLNKLTIIPSGIIVTHAKSDTLFGLPIFSALSASEILDGSCAVIGAFMGANEEMIKEILKKDVPVFALPDDVVCALFNLDKAKAFLLDAFSYEYDALSSKSDWKRILVIRLDVLGDLITTTAFLRELCKNCHHAEITLIIHKQNYHLFKECPYVDKILLYDGPIIRWHLDAQMQLINEIKNRVKKFKGSYWHSNIHYDVTFLPCTLLQGTNCLETFCLATEAPTKCLVGRVNSYRLDERLLYSFLKGKLSLISYEKEEKHESRYMLDMLEKCGCEINNDKLELWTDYDAELYARVHLPSSTRQRVQYVAVGIVGSKPNRNWTIDKYSSFIESVLAKENYMIGSIKFVLFGGKDAVDSARKLKGTLSEYYKQYVINMCGMTNLMQAVALMRRCSVYVGADTGVMHMAAACDVPVIEISIALPDCPVANGSSPVRMGPWGVPKVILRPKKAKGYCRGICKCNEPHCIENIEVDDVIKAFYTIKRR